MYKAGIFTYSKFCAAKQRCDCAARNRRAVSSPVSYSELAMHYSALIVRAELDVRYRKQSIVARCTPPAAASSQTLSIIFNGTAQLSCHWQK